MTQTSQKLFLYACIATASAACGSSGTASSSTAPTAAPMEPQPATAAAPPPETEEQAVVPAPATDLMAAEMMAYEAAKPVFEESCASCHTHIPGKKMSKGVMHFAMGSYPYQGHHASELGVIIRVAIGGTDKAATMPKDDPGSLQGEDLQTLLSWADAFDAAATAKVGYHAEKDHHGGHDKMDHPGSTNYSHGDDHKKPASKDKKHSHKH